MIYRLEWTDRRGGFHSDQGSFERLTKKLETIRCPADLWAIEEVSTPGRDIICC